MHHAAPPPWYRQFWPWFIIAIPASAVIGGALMITLASRQPAFMVADDYYKEGLAINRRLEKNHAAAAQDVQVLLRFAPEQARLTLDATKAGAALDATLLLRLTHPTLADQDLTLQLSPLQAGRYQAQLTGLSAGRWHISLEPLGGDWRVSGRAALDRPAQLRLRGQP